MSAPVSIYGGLTCASGKWAYLARAVPVVTGTAPSFALQIAVSAGAVDAGSDIEVKGATAWSR